MTKKSVVLVFIHHYFPGFKLGGPVRSVLNMVDHLGETFDFKIITSDRDVMDRVPYANVRVDAWNTVGKAQVYYASPERRSIRDLAKLVSETRHDVLYLNSFFDLEFTLLPLLARRLGWIPKRPVIVAPRGEFSPGALAIKRWKKLPFIRCARTVNLYRNVIWHASNEHEAQDIRLGLGAVGGRIMLACNLPTRTSLPAITDSTRLDTARPLRVVFLSRISPKKNLAFALETLAKVSMPVEFDIWGTIEDEQYWSECQSIIAKMPSHIVVTYRGVADNTRVCSIMSGYDLFLLPTRGENYGHVIIEALSSGLPVLTSDQTPWSDLEACGIGWTAPLDDMNPFVRVIESECARDSLSRGERRERIIDYAMKHVNNEDVALQNRLLFEFARDAA